MTDLRAQLERHLADAAAHVRSDVEAAMTAIRAADVTTLPALARLTATAELASERAGGCWLLGELTHTDGVRALRDALSDHVPEVQARALWALNLFYDPALFAPAGPALIAIMRHHPDTSARSFAALMLGESRASGAVDPLLETMVDDTQDPVVRGAATEALNWHSDPRIMPALIAALSDPEVEVRYNAAYSLGSVGDARAFAGLEQVAAIDQASIEGQGSVRDQALFSLECIRCKLSRAAE